MQAEGNARDSHAYRPIDLGRAAGVSTQMVRRYEASGFLPPGQRTTAGYRRYGARHLDAIRAARAMQRGYGWQTALEVMRHYHGGDLAGALAVVDACHARLDRRRREIDETLRALREIARAAPSRQPAVPAPTSARRGALRIGEAARCLGVRPSAIRFWEAQGLLHPPRERWSRYRTYDDAELLRLQIVVLLRGAGYQFEAIKTALDELGDGRPGPALTAIERRRDELTRASRRCAEATAAFWNYVEAGEASTTER